MSSVIFSDAWLAKNDSDASQPIHGSVEVEVSRRDSVTFLEIAFTDDAGSAGTASKIEIVGTRAVDLLRRYCEWALAENGPPAVTQLSWDGMESEDVDLVLSVLLRRKIGNVLALGNKVMTPLSEANIVTLNQLVQFSDVELLKIPNIGRKGLNEISAELRRHGLALKKW